MTSIYFISGVSGAGKSAIIPHLKLSLPSQKYSIRDFDERGVPEGVDEKWRREQTEYWLQVAVKNAKRGVSTVICGLTRPDEILKSESASEAPPIRLCLLDVSDEKIRERLSKRFKTPESVINLKRVCRTTPKKFITANIKFAKILRNLFRKHRAHIIDTADDSEIDTAGKAVEWVRSN